MDCLTDRISLRAQIARWRRAGERVALVPTMGNLHAGHLSLVQEAKGCADHVVTSIFVNPLQFGAGEDFSAYPRTLAEDQRQLVEQGCDLLFAPGVETLYPHGQEGHTRVEVPGLSDLHCGASRPGHFVGVATVVCKLLNLVQPDVALFGEKDCQQLLVIRRMVEDLALPVDIRGVPTVREPDGLAMSSRNGYLSPDERARAPALYATLQTAARALESGQGLTEVERAACEALVAAGLKPDYVRVCDAATLQPAEVSDRERVILAAARLGRARLIDNVRLGNAS